MTTQSPTTTRTRSEPQRTTEPDADDLSLDEVYGILSNGRRRIVCRHLREESGGTTLGELAEHVASVENDTPIPQLSSQERKRAYVGLYQCHLPKMDSTGVVDFDEDRKTVAAGDGLEPVLRFLPDDEDATRTGGTRGWTTTVSDLTRSVGGLFSRDGRHGSRNGPRHRLELRPVTALLARPVVRLGRTQLSPTHPLFGLGRCRRSRFPSSRVP